VAVLLIKKNKVWQCFTKKEGNEKRNQISLSPDWIFGLEMLHGHGGEVA
jgi:hypothetical protein